MIIQLSTPFLEGLLPEGTTFGDQITPHIMREIIYKYDAVIGEVLVGGESVGTKPRLSYAPIVAWGNAKELASKGETMLTVSPYKSDFCTVALSESKNIEGTEDGVRWQTAKSLCGIYGGYWQIQIRHPYKASDTLISGEDLEEDFTKAIDIATEERLKKVDSPYCKTCASYHPLEQACLTPR